MQKGWSFTGNSFSIMNQAELKKLIPSLQKRMNKHATTKTKKWWEAYMKNVIPFRGVKMKEVRNSVHDWHTSELESQKLSTNDFFKLAFLLLEEAHSEDKMAGILLLDEILIQQDRLDWKKDLPKLADAFHPDRINDWNLCDWYCIKVLGKLIDQGKKPAGEVISQWKTSGNLWKKRASVVSFVMLAQKGNENFSGFSDRVLKNCHTTVRSPERFHQTGTGWVLRELGRAEEMQVLEFIDSNLEHFSREGLRYALEKMPERKRSMRMDKHKQI